MLQNVLEGTGQTPQQRLIQPQKSMVSRLGNPGLRPYHPEHARSHLTSEAKQGGAWLVLGWEIGKPWFKHNNFSFAQHIWILYVSAKHSTRCLEETEYFLGIYREAPQSVGSSIQVMVSIRICPLWNKGLWVQELKTSEQPRLDPKVHASPGVSL